MMKLYYSPGACSLAAHIILEELEVPYEAVAVDLKTHKVGNQDYHIINFRGAVPALQLEDGKLITQNVAILSYLGDLVPENPRMPKVGTIDRIRAYEWLAFLSSDVHKTFSPLFSPSSFVKSPEAQAELKEIARGNVERILQSIDDRLITPQHYALGDRFSVVDAYLYVFYRWAVHFEISTVSWYHYKALKQRVVERPATQAALAAEGLEW